MKIRNKIALLLLVSTTIIIVSLVAFVYIFVSRDTTLEFDQKLSYRIHLLQRSFADSTHVNKYINEDKLFQEKSYIIRIGKDSAFFAKRSWPELERLRIHSNGQANWENDNTFFLGELYHWKGQSYIIVISALDAFQKEYMSNLEKVLLTGLGIAIFFLIAMAFIFSRNIFTPVQNITEQVKKIGSGNLHLRLPRNKGEDEINNLTDTFNEMLDRMETAFEAQKNFVSQASHEFNTPLTTIIGEAEFALTKDRPAEQYVDALKIILSESERLRDLTLNLLRLAQAQYINQKILMEPVRLDEMILDIKRIQENLYPKTKIQLEYEGQLRTEQSVSIMGNASLLHLAISNIIVNATKYSHYQTVHVKLILNDKTVDMIVIDTGVGIPEEDLSKIFDPYFRASNSHNFSGFGIGLPLAYSIFRMHNGIVSIKSKVDIGTEVCVSFSTI